MQVGLPLEPSPREMTWTSVWWNGELVATLAWGELEKPLPELIELPRTLPPRPDMLRFDPGTAPGTVPGANPGHVPEEIPA